MKTSVLLSTTRLLSSTIAVIMLGIWINQLTSNETGKRGFFATVAKLGPANLLVIAAIGSLAAAEAIARRAQSRNDREFAYRYKLLQQRQRRMLEANLGVTCELISRIIGVQCNARYFRQVVGDDGKSYLEQDRDLAVLNIVMPREFGFTKVSVDTPHFISGRSFRDRIPIYEELPVDHSKLYSREVKKMIEPKQRWVLSCPVLNIDPATNRHRYDVHPHGVIVFYGTEVPKCAADSPEMETAIRQAEQFAENISHVENMTNLAISPVEAT